MRHRVLGLLLLAIGCRSGTDPEPVDQHVPFEGDCQAAFQAPALESFLHPTDAAITQSAGPANHQLRDALVETGASGDLRARIEYGAMGSELEDERVQFFLQRCPDWQSLGIVDTDDEGVAQIALPTNLPKGDYRVRAVVLGDGTVADGTVSVWPEDVQIILTSIDSTLTTGPFGSVSDVMSGTTPTMIPGASTVMDTWASKDYRIVYVAPRPRSLSRHIRAWLTVNGFPSGILRLTDEAVELAGDTDEQQFEEAFVQDLQVRLGAQVVRAYASSASDIAAYAAAGIPPASTYTIGARAGQGGTNAIAGDFTAHVAVVTSFAAADQP